MMRDRERYSERQREIVRDRETGRDSNRRREIVRDRETDTK